VYGGVAPNVVRHAVTVLRTFHDVLAALHAALRRANVPHMVAGSVAASAHGLARSTQDIDVVIEAWRE
jgi:hypothetical protein